MFKKAALILVPIIILIFGADFFLFKNLKSLDVYTKLPTFSLVNIKNVLQPETKIIIIGDVMLGRSVMGTSLSKNNPNYPFEKVKDTLTSADIVFANLENPIIPNCPYTDSGFKFCADPKMIEGLKNSGVDIVNLANNHTKNYGDEGFVQTKNYLKENGIDYVGDDNLVVKKINGVNFGFLGFDFVSLSPKEEDYQLIRDSKSKVNVLVVMPHWGNEYTPKANEYQKKIAKSLVEAGADIIVGTHPHWIQNIESIGGKSVFYSLGNFIFDQMWSEETKKGLAIRLTYQKHKLVKTEELPIYMKNFAQPEWVVN